MQTYREWLENAPKVTRGARKGLPKASSLPTGVVLYHGPSRIDGEEIVCVATGMFGDSANPKTGAMVQTWILRADMHPVEALATGSDVSICGGCPHRPKDHDGEGFSQRSCYVNIMGPAGVFRAFAKGRYPVAERGDYADLFGGRMVRLGSYGDPAAVPTEVWEGVTSEAEGWTGYTHQWRSPRLRDTLRFCQLSADSCEDLKAADAMAVGSFRVLAEGEQPKAGEMVCPASKEAGFKATCAECGACSGATGAKVVIAAHGAGVKHATKVERRPFTARTLASMRKDRGMIHLPVLQVA